MSPRFVAHTLVVSALGLMALVSSSCGAAANSAQVAMPPPEVEVLPVAEETVQLHSEWVATIDGQVNAQIQPQVSGYVVQQNYREGDFVRKGQILFVIDPRPFEAIVEQQRGMLAQAESQVTQAESQVLQSESQATQATAQLRKAQLDVKRDTPLAQAHAIPQSQLDTEVQALAAAEAALQAAKANIAASQAAVKTAKAAVMSARANLAQGELNLGFTQVRSLIDGIAGVAQTQIGNLVKTDSVLTTVSQVDPVRVYFPISEREYMDLAGKSKSDAIGNLLNSSKAPSLELILTNGATFPHKGRVAFADRQVDAQTGTIRLAATFPNPGNVLRPGQFGRVRALTRQQDGALLIPQRAVTELQGKFQVAVVGAGNKVQLRTVTLGPILESRFIVESGLRAGDKVVVEGLAKAMDGAVVNPKPARASLAKPVAQGL